MYTLEHTLGGMYTLEHTLGGMYNGTYFSWFPGQEVCFPDLTYQNTYLCLETPTCITLPQEQWEGQILDMKNI